MNHSRAQRLLSAYLDEELVSDEMAQVGKHLADCPVCRAEVQELRTLKRLLGSLEQPELPAGFAARAWSHLEVRHMPDGVGGLPICRDLRRRSSYWRWFWPW